MASSASFIEYVTELLGGAGEVRARRMFGECGLYLDGVFFAMVCDDMLYIKQTQVNPPEELCPVLCPPYEGAKDAVRIDEPERTAQLCAFARDTAKALAEKKPRRAGKKSV